MFKLRHKSLLAGLLALGISASAETITVTNTNGSGPGSFEEAIQLANAHVSPSTIVFNIPGVGRKEIVGTFSDITTPMTIDGTGSGVVLVNNAINVPGLDIGLYITGTAAGTIVRGLGIESYVFGIAVDAGLVTIEGNTFNNYGPNVRLKYGSSAIVQQVVIRNNIFTGESEAVLGFSGGGTIDDIEISSNVISGGEIVLGGFGGVATNLFIDRNVISGSTVNSTDGAITLLNVSGSKVSGNLIANSSSKGVYMLGSQDTIINNTFSGNIGIDIDTEGGGQVIDDNTITGHHVFAGIQAKVIFSSIGKNTITNGKIHAIEARRGAIWNNSISNHGGPSAEGGVTLENCQNQSVYNNVIQNGTSHGVLLNDGGANIVSENTITGNGRSGVALIGGSTLNVISKNVIHSNHADALGGHSGIALINGNGNQTSPVITSVELVGSNFVVSGTSSTVQGSVEIFLSDENSNLYGFTQNAYQYVGITSTDPNGDWSITFPSAGFDNDAYFIATSKTNPFAAAHPNSTSSFSLSQNATTAPSFFKSNLVESSTKEGLDLSVYPTPFNNTTQLDLSSLEGASTVKVTDVNGKVVFETTTNNATQLQIGGSYKPGLYLISVTNNNTVRTLRAIKR